MPLGPERRRFIVLALFLGSTAVMGLTFSPQVVAVWLLMWLFTRRYGSGVEGSGFLVFLLAFYLFYPLSSSFRGIHERGVVLAGVLLLFAGVCRPDVRKLLKESRAARAIWIGWIAWGVLAYAPVLLFHVVPDLAPLSLLHRPGSPIQLARETTILKTAVPTIVSVIAMVIPPHGARRMKDIDALGRALLWGGIILMALSLIRYAFYVDFVPQNYADIRFEGFRMSGFFNPDPNNFGRQLILPIVFVAALVLRSTRRATVAQWVFLSMGLVCVLLTFSRTTYVSLSVALVTLAALNRLRARTLMFVVGIAAVVVVAVAAFNVYTYFGSGGDRASLGNLALRLRLYQAAVVILRQNPWFGAWPGGWQITLENLQVAATLYGYSTHNMLLSLAVEWGIPMALLLLGALALSFRLGVSIARAPRGSSLGADGRTTAAVGAAVAAGAVGLFVHGLTEIVPPHYVFLNLGIGLAAARFMSARVNAIRPREQASVGAYDAGRGA